MARRVVLVRVVQVVRGDEREAQVLREPVQVGHDAALDAEPVVHDLAEVVLGPEDVAEVRRGLHGLVVLAEAEARLHLAGRAAGGGDEALRVGAEQLAVHAGLEVVALERGARREAEEVVHALRRLGEHREVRVGAGSGDVVLAAVAPPDARAVAAVRARRDVRLGADDGLHARGLGLLPEVERAEHVAVVGDRDGRHLLLGRGLHERADAGRPVEHRVLAVDVEVDERVVAGHGSLLLIGRRCSNHRQAPGGPPGVSRVSPRGRRARAAGRPDMSSRTTPGRPWRDA